MNRIVVLVLMFIACAAGSAEAGSDHAFGQAAGNCGGVWRLPDTSQTVHFSTAAGDDSDYRPAPVQPAYAIFNPIGVSSVTVDNVTGLMWVTNPADAGMGGTYTWENALITCEGLGYATYTDWRLPNIKELQSIADYNVINPAVNMAYFLNTKSLTYWSSTTYLPSTIVAWAIGFSYGAVSNGTKTGSNYARCVRAGP